MATESPLLIVRADATNAIGAGHVMRQIALGQAWLQLGGDCCFVSRDLPQSIQDRLAREQFEVISVAGDQSSHSEVELLRSVVDRAPAGAVVVDGYHLDQDYCDSIARLECATMVTDDFGHLNFYGTDFVLNQNLGARAELYENRAAATRPLVGADYSLIRSELRQSPGRYRVRDGSIRRILVTLGGADPDNGTELIVRALQQVPSDSLKVRLIIGSLFKETERLHRLVAGDNRFEIVSNVADMSRLYAWADLAVAAGGSSNWEMCSFGLPRVIVVIADNQREIAATLDSHNAGVNLGPVKQLSSDKVSQAVASLLQDPDRVVEMGSAAASMIDGLGAIRCAAELMRSALARRNRESDLADSKQTADSETVFRAASLDDWQLLLSWRNDQASRMASRHSEVIEPESHRRWLASAVDNPRRILLVAEQDATPVGTVRIDCGDVSELSWAVAPEMRGRGIGRTIVSRAASFVSGPLRAVTHRTNESSQRLARRAGFTIDRTEGDWISFVRMPQGVTPHDV